MAGFSSQLPPLAHIAKEAGKVVRAMQADIVDDFTSKKFLKSHCKKDGSVVTDADIEAHNIITRMLNERFPNIAIVSEEGTPEEINTAIMANERFETDPLDNTGGYATKDRNGNLQDGYSVNIGRVKDGKAVEGAVYFPSKEELFFTSEDGKTAYVQKGDSAPKQINVRNFPRNPIEVVTGFNESHLEHLGDKAKNLSQEPAQYRTMKVADGTYDIGPINKGKGGYNTWDIAGPHAVLIAAGGEFLTGDFMNGKGTPLEYTHDYKVPEHIAGGLDTFVALGLMQKDVLKRKSATAIA